MDRACGPVARSRWGGRSRDLWTGDGGLRPGFRTPAPAGPGCCQRGRVRSHLLCPEVGEPVGGAGPQRDRHRSGRRPRCRRGRGQRLSLPRRGGGPSGKRPVTAAAAVDRHGGRRLPPPDQSGPRSPSAYPCGGGQPGPRGRWHLVGSRRPAGLRPCSGGRVDLSGEAPFRTVGQAGCGVGGPAFGAWRCGGCRRGTAAALLAAISRHRRVCCGSPRRCLWPPPRRLLCHPTGQGPHPIPRVTGLVVERPRR